MDYKAEMIYLSSSNGALLEIAEDKLSPEDLNYVHSLDVYKKEKRKVAYPLFFFPYPSTDIVRNRNPNAVSAQPFCALLFLWPDDVRLVFRVGCRALGGAVPPHATRKSTIYTLLHPTISSGSYNPRNSAGTLGSGSYRSLQRG